MRLVIHEYDCNGEAGSFADWVAVNYPDIAIEFCERTSGAGGGLSDDENNELDHPDLWSEYCNS